MSRRNAIVEVLRITGSTGGCGAKTCWQKDAQRNRSRTLQAPQIDNRMRQVVNDAD